MIDHEKILILGLASAAILMVGCTSTPKIEKLVSGKCIIDGDSAPEWVCGNIKLKDKYADVGSAKLTQAGYNFARTEAITNARAALSNQINVLVKAKTENFLRTTGIGKSETIDKVTTSITKQVSKNTLRGSAQEAMWKGKTELFVLVSVPKKSVIENTKNSLKTSFKNDNALWQEFKAKQSLDSLDKEFE